MIDYVIVIYKNYDLLELQAHNFKKRFKPEQYRLVIVDNTPDSEKVPIVLNNKKHLILPLESKPTFDGVSHGRAIDYGLTFCTSEIVGIIDSDFFVLNNNMHSYVQNKFSEGYKAVGCEYNDGKDTAAWVNINPKNFENIPCCFGAYYDLNLARSASWVVTEEDVSQNRTSGFVEVGSKVRKFILENNIKTMSWQNDAKDYGTGFFKNENNEMMGVHYVAGSHRRWNSSSKAELERIINAEYETA
jgi:hypothetical protein